MDYSCPLYGNFFHVPAWYVDVLIRRKPADIKYLVFRTLESAGVDLEVMVHLESMAQLMQNAVRMITDHRQTITAARKWDLLLLAGIGQILSIDFNKVSGLFTRSSCTKIDFIDIMTNYMFLQ